MHFAEHRRNMRTETNHKLVPVATGPYKVLEALYDTVVIRTVQGGKKRISPDRVVITTHQRKEISEERAEIEEE